MSSISSFYIISIVVPDPEISLWIPAFGADAAVANPIGINTLLPHGWSTSFINGKPVFSNGPRSLPRNPPDYYIILHSLDFDSLTLADKLFAKALRRFATYLLVNNKFYGKLVSSLELSIMFGDSLDFTSVSFFIADFDLLSCEFVNFKFKLLYWVILY